MTDEIRFWIGLLFAPSILLAGWMVRVAITQSRQEDRIGRIEGDLKEVKTDQHEILEKLDQLNINVVQLVERVKTLFKDNSR